MSLKTFQNLQANPCGRVSASNFIQKETLPKVFSCEFCDIFKTSSGSIFMFKILYNLHLVVNIPGRGEFSPKYTNTRRDTLLLEY